MAQLAVQKIVPGGLGAAFVAAAVGGDTMPAGERRFLRVKNAGGAGVNVTIQSIRPCDQGFEHDLVVNVPDGDELDIGPLPAGRFGPQVQISYSAVAGVTVAALEV